ncbi:MAG: hypothetical protein QOH89_3775 [Pseudonocardiales bacterium]|jgi:hypothetical protein|nr:hypothetical protein [Pseudonocardiales bacterium]
MTAGRVGIVALVCIALALSGCSATSDSAADDAATQFVRAVEQRDGDLACSLLTPAAADSAGGVAGTPCAQAVLKLRVEGSDVSHTEVWGDAAMIRVGSDTVFLRRMGDGWRVSAAGCTYRPDRPYACDLEA